MATNDRSVRAPDAADRPTAGVGMAHPTVVPTNFDEEAADDPE